MEMSPALIRHFRVAMHLKRRTLHAFFDNTESHSQSWDQNLELVFADQTFHFVEEETQRLSYFLFCSAESLATSSEGTD